MGSNGQLELRRAILQNKDPLSGSRFENLANQIVEGEDMGDEMGD